MAVEAKKSQISFEIFYFYLLLEKAKSCLVLNETMQR